MLDEEKKLIDELALVDGDALHALADFLFGFADCAKDFPGIVGLELNGAHFAAAVGIAAFHNSRSAFGVIAGLEHKDVLLGVLAAHIGAAQQLGCFVAAHWAHPQFEFALQVRVSLRLKAAESRAAREPSGFSS